MPPLARRCRLLSVSGLFTLAAVMPSSVVFAQEPNPGDFPGRDRIADLLRQSLDFEAIPPEEVLRFNLHNGDLAVTTDIRPDFSGSREIRVRGMPGFSRIQAGTRFRGAMGLAPYFEFNHTRYGDEDGADTTTRVYTQGGSVRVERTWRDGDANISVMFTQGTNISRRGRFEPRVGQGERVRLRARVNGEQTWEAATFEELLLKYPGPTARYLGPVLRDFGQDAAVFRVDAQLGWQLFPDAVETDDATESKVRTLVDQLDAEDFRVREQSTADLETIGGPAIAALEEYDRVPLSPEQNTRIDAILSRYGKLDEGEVATLLEDAEFLLRCFVYCDVEPVRAAAAKALLGKLEGQEPKFEGKLDPTAGLPERVKMGDAARERLPEEH